MQRVVFEDRDMAAGPRQADHLTQHAEWCGQAEQALR